jgi:hypothetical protein
MSPAAPLRLTRGLPNPPSVGGPCKALLPPPSGRSLRSLGFCFPLAANGCFAALAPHLAVGPLTLVSLAGPPSLPPHPLNPSRHPRQPFTPQQGERLGLEQVEGGWVAKSRNEALRATRARGAPPLGGERVRRSSHSPLGESKIQVSKANVPKEGGAVLCTDPRRRVDLANP